VRGQEAAAPGSVHACDAPALWTAGTLLGAAGDLARVAELAGFGTPTARLATRATTDHLVSACGPVLPALQPLLRPMDSTQPFSILPVSVTTVANSAYARNMNTGAIWGGRGLSLGVAAGAAFRWGPVSARIAPQFVWQQNDDFETAAAPFRALSPLIHVGHGTVIDLPQRFGEEAFWSVEGGQSFVRADVVGVGFGFSTENRRIGPTMRNPILMSYNAPGFPHVFLEMSRPRSIWIGDLDVQVFWGRLDESGYWDNDPANDRRLIGALMMTFMPRGVPGLSLGAARIHHTTWGPDGLGLDEYLAAIVDLPFSSQGGNAPGNGLAALMARWAFPASGFEVFAEWAREDYSWDFGHFKKEPDHSQAYALGFQQLLPSAAGLFRLHGELTYLGAAAPLRSGSGAVTWYTHSEVRQGHTHRGQLLGAPIGPGADAQYLGLDLLHSRGLSGFFLERVRYNADAYFGSWARFYGPNGHDVELTAGLRQAYTWRAADIHATMTFSNRENRDFIGLDGADWNFRTENNLGLQVGVSWWPGHRRTAAPAASR
jgi:hypothetical protein